MPRVLITGAAGFIGMHASIRFLREGWDVIGIDNLNPYYSVDLKKSRVKEITNIAAKKSLNFSLLNEDLNSSVWSKIGDINFDAVIHLAAQAGVRYSIENPLAYLESNVLGFQRVLEFVKSRNITRFLYASSSSVYGDNSKQPFSEEEQCNSPKSYYAATKKMNELMAYSYFRMHNIGSIGLRFFTVYGPWGRPDMAPMLFASSAFNNSPIKIFNYGNQKRDFTYIDDIIEGIFGLVVLTEFPLGADVLNIGCGKPVKLMVFIEEIERITSLQFKKEFVEPQNGDVAETYADTTKLHKLSGYKSTIDLEEGMKHFISWYKEYYNILQ